MRFYLVLVVIATLHHRVLAKLPPGVEPCSRNDPNLNECMVNNGNKAIPLLAGGVPELGLLPFDPLHVDELRVDDSDTSRQVALDLNLKNADYFGLAQHRIKSADINLKDGVLVWKGVVPRLEILGTHEVGGRVLILPINGKGAFNFTLDHIDFTYTMKVKHITKKGKDYLQPYESNMDFDMKRAYFYLEGLFNGDKRLGDHMNMFMNENWREIINDVGKPMGEIINLSTMQEFSRVCSLASFDELFPA